MTKNTELKGVRRGTQRQKKAAKLLVENITAEVPLTSGEIVANSGYGVSMKKNPQVVLESDGVKTELAILGFSEEKAKEVVGAILSNEESQDKDRLKAADMVFDVFGTKAPVKSINLQVNIENRTYVESLLPEVINKMKEDESN